MVLELQALVHLQKSNLNEKANKIDELTEQLTKLNEEQEKKKTQAINKEVNKPSSKKPEWDNVGNPKSGKPSKRKRKRKKRPGCGNRSKSDLTLGATHHIKLSICPGCETDL
jgi:hypothetical protein